MQCKHCKTQISENALSAPFCEECLSAVCNTIPLATLKEFSITKLEVAKKEGEAATILDPNAHRYIDKLAA